MSWFSENKFLAVFGGVMVVGVGALGYLTMGASSEYETAKGEYDTEVTKLRGLYDTKPSPMQDNLDEYRKREKAFSEQIAALQKDLGAIEIKTEPVSPTGFQDKLKEAVSRVVAKAAEMEMKLPEKFYMGFDEYQNTPPKDVSAPSMLRELRSLEIVMNLLLQSKKAELKSIARNAEEKKQPDVKPDPKGGKAKGDADKKLIHKISYKVDFIASQDQFKTVLNGITGSKEQFFVVRNLHIKNEKPEAPGKNAPGAGGGGAQPADPAAPAPAAAGTPAAAAAAAPAGGDLQAIFGNEKLEVSLDLDVLDFADPETPAAAKNSGKPQPK